MSQFDRKLTSLQVNSLLRDYLDGWKPKELSVIYKVSIRTVYRKISTLEERYTPVKVKRYTPPPRKRPPLKPCGTNAAYQRHRKNGEYPCTPCLEAHALDVKKAKARIKKRGRKKK